MISYKDNMITTFLEPKKIKEWVVMFATPLGLCEKLDQAVEACKRNDFDPNLCVKAVAVATCEDGTYEGVL